MEFYGGSLTEFLHPRIGTNAYWVCLSLPGRVENKNPGQARDLF
jgi:hypothetical protein